MMLPRRRVKRARDRDREWKGRDRDREEKREMSVRRKAMSGGGVAVT
jgi:hypothetical protein